MEIIATVITAVLTVFSPLIIAYYKRESWGKLAKTALPIVVSLAIAVFYLWYQGGIPSGADIFQVIMTVYGVQQLAYTTILRGLSTILERMNDPAQNGRHEAQVNGNSTLIQRKRE